MVPQILQHPPRLRRILLLAMVALTILWIHRLGRLRVTAFESPERFTRSEVIARCQWICEQLYPYEAQYDVCVTGQKWYALNGAPGRSWMVDACDTRGRQLVHAALDGDTGELWILTPAAPIGLPAQAPRNEISAEEARHLSGLWLEFLGFAPEANAWSRRQSLRWPGGAWIEVYTTPSRTCHLYLDGAGRLIKMQRRSITHRTRERKK